MIRAAAKNFCMKYSGGGFSGSVRANRRGTGRRITDGFSGRYTLAAGAAAFPGRATAAYDSAVASRLARIDDQGTHLAIRTCCLRHFALRQSVRRHFVMEKIRISRRPSIASAMAAWPGQRSCTERSSLITTWLTLTRRGN